MSAFTTRIELHDALWSDYELLHKEMRRQGFSQTIQSGTGTLYELPPAEYNFKGDVIRKNVLDRAKTALAATRKSGAILVTESVGRSWCALSEA